MRKLAYLALSCLPVPALAAPKYVFLFIGDGMGLSQVAATEIFMSAREGVLPEISKPLSFTRFPTQGFVTTYDTTSYIPDSASAGTAIATGHKTADGVIAMDSKQKERLTSLAKTAHKAGMKVGILTSVSIDHATPAVFYANAPSRDDMYDIARQLPESGFEYFAGGPAVDPDGDHAKEKHGNVYAYARSKGYTLVEKDKDFRAVRPTTGQKFWVMAERTGEHNSLPYEIDRPKEAITLADYTKKAISVLENPKGFFMMVEGGKIDWASHFNDARTVIGEVMAFDESVKVALEFAKAHPKETLIVVTADHETGGLALGNAGTRYGSFLHVLRHQSVSHVKFNEILRAAKSTMSTENSAPFWTLVENHFGLSANAKDPHLKLSPYETERLNKALAATLANKSPSNPQSASEQEYNDYGGYPAATVTLTHILNEKAGIGWSTWAHSASPVPIYAWGEGREKFDGYFDNTQITPRLKALMGLK